MRRKPLWWLYLLLWLVVYGLPVAAAIYIINLGEDAPRWIIQTARIGHIESSVAATGKLEPKHYVEVGAQVSGQLRTLYVEEGDSVQRGELLAEIDASVFETKVRTAEAALEGKRAQLRQQLAELELAQQRLKRNRKLINQNAVSIDELAKDRTDVKVLQARISATKAQIKADEAALEGNRVTLSYARIAAPINGTVINLKVRQGQTLNANQNTPTILKLVDLTTLTLRAEVSEADVSKLQVGMPVEFSVLSQPERKWSSKVRQVLPSPKVINDVVLYQVLADVDNAEGLLMDSMSAQVFFVRQREQNTLMVPLGAVSSGNQGASVRVIGPNGIERRTIRTGIKNRTHIQVLAGLQAGERIIAGRMRRNNRNNAIGLGSNSMSSMSRGRRRGG